MSSRSRAALAVWRGRTARTPGNRAFVIYAIFLVGLVAIVPIARAVWLSASSAAGVAVLGSAAAPGVTMLVVAALWASALMLGRDRGPALLPPFVTHALVTSDLPRSDIFAGSLLRAGALVTVLTTVAAGFVGTSLLSAGLTDAVEVAVFIAVGALAGVITTFAWLAGQALARTAVPVGLGILTLGAITAVVPIMQPFTPWGWVGLLYPVAPVSPGTSSPVILAVLAVLAAALASIAPPLLNRLGLAELSTQASSWHAATTHAAGMDFGAAATIYQRRPHRGRSIRAIRSTRSLPLTFLIRDAIGAVRTPGRLIVGVISLAAAGALLTLAFAPATPGWLLGAVAGLLIFAGLGPVTDGIRHAAHVASDLPLYGIRDDRLLVYHALFPLVVAVAVLLATGIVCAAIFGIGVVAPVISSIALGLLGLLIRVNNALKGSLPTSLLTPIPTAVGDLGAAARLAWSLDGALLAALAGTSATLAFDSPVLLIGVSLTVAAIGIARWRSRR